MDSAMLAAHYRVWSPDGRYSVFEVAEVVNGWGFPAPSERITATNFATFQKPRVSLTICISDLFSVGRPSTKLTARYLHAAHSLSDLSDRRGRAKGPMRSDRADRFQ